MRKEEYQDNLRADYKINNSYYSQNISEKPTGKTLGRLVVDENEDLHVITNIRKD